jgi:hypothetical protein
VRYACGVLYGVLARCFFFFHSSNPTCHFPSQVRASSCVIIVLGLGTQLLLFSRFQLELIPEALASPVKPRWHLRLKPRSVRSVCSEFFYIPTDWSISIEILLIRLALWWKYHTYFILSILKKASYLRKVEMFFFRTEGVLCKPSHVNNFDLNKYGNKK